MLKTEYVKDEEATVDQHGRDLSRKNKILDTDQPRYIFVHTIQGIALVANTLILSLLWHSLRILYFPHYFFAKVRSMVIKFISGGSFPVVSFDTSQRPRKEGDLFILSPCTQHSVLQLRWIKTLIVPETSDSQDVPTLCLSLGEIFKQYLKTI